MSLFDPYSIERPDPKLFRYYLCLALLAGPLVPAVLLPLWFRYETLRYHFDEDGVSMRWGILFRKEIYLTYRRIQDIHLTRNLLQRWMGLATISLQTASGSSQAEMSIEGILQAEELRDFLYGRMRGSRGEPEIAAVSVTTATDDQAALGTVSLTNSAEGGSSVHVLLEEIRDALARIADK